MQSLDISLQSSGLESITMEEELLVDVEWRFTLASYGTSSLPMTLTISSIVSNW